MFTHSVEPLGSTASGADSRLIDFHPVVGDGAYLPTPPIRRAYFEIAQAVAEREPGISFVAFSRFGKTFAISVLADQLGTAFPNVPVLSANAVQNIQFKDVTFYTQLMAGFTLPTVFAVNVKARILRSKLIRFLWTLAESRQSDRIVLFIDEAQNLSEPELTALRDITNDLALFAHVQLEIILFGDLRLVNTRTALLQSGRTDLVGRFMVRQFEFQGIGSLEDLVETMTCYDDVSISEYPEKSGIAYSAFFMPLAFRDGWTLQQEAPLAWECFKRAARPHGGFKQIGMKWVASSIRAFLTWQSEGDRAGFKGDHEMWMAAISHSGFALTLGVTYSPEAKVPAAAPAEHLRQTMVNPT